MTLNFIRVLHKIDIDHVQLMRIFTVIPAVLILLAGAGILWIYFFVFSLLPEKHSSVEIQGLSSKVSVVRDGTGIPVIVGDTEEDVALVLGYVMAEDRLWQMDFLRKAGQGRLAEIRGPEYLDGDQIIRTVRACSRGLEDTNTLQEAETRWIERFIQGVNRYIHYHQGKLPVEFSLQQSGCSLFSIDDLTSIVYALAWETSPASRVDPVMIQVMGRLGTDRGLEVFPTDPAVSKVSISSDLNGWEPKGLQFSRVWSGGPPLKVPGFRGGCAWGVAPERSHSGRALVASSFYQTLSAPGFWYRARLVAGSFHLAGAFIPGVPVAMSGANQSLSWGCFSTPVDDADYYIERLDSQDARAYYRVDRWRKLQELRENYRVKGGSSVTRSILLTDVGPLVSEIDGGRALSLRWTGQADLGFIPALLRLNRASNGHELKNSLSVLTAPSLYVAWADEQGACGIQSAGRIPIRPPGSDGIVPLPAWTGVNNWLGFIPFNELPALVTNGQGVVAMSDGRPGGTYYPFFVSCYWNHVSKVDRIQALLEDSKTHNRDTLARIQMDAHSILGETLVPVFLKAVSRGVRLDGIEEDVAEVLRTWDFQMDVASSGAAVFALMYNSVVEGILLEPLGRDLYARFTSMPQMLPGLVEKILIGGQGGWLGFKDPNRFLRDRFSIAVGRGSSLMGDDPKKWRWGHLHSAVFRHPLADRSRFLEALYEVGPFPLSGSTDTINLSAWSPSRPYGVVEGVSYRQVADMTYPPSVLGIGPLGASAHFFSPHYKDQTPAWLAGGSTPDPIQSSVIGQDESPNAVIFRPASATTVSMK